MRIRSAEDRLFLRFQRTGEPRALGRLFDRTAADLLRVARYLTGDRALAEDLVQTTFLRAIEGAAGYDAARPVLPWLIGILTHQAHDLRRARERAARVVLPQSGADPGPGAAVADAEFRAACVAAMRGLPQPYREVVGLHLDAGLGAVEISQRLARPVDTVRKQLGRGLGLLRRALPAGFGGAVVVAATSPRVLAAMRDVVTARATAVGVTTGLGATTLLGGLAMKKVTMAAAGLLALGLGVLAWGLPNRTRAGLVGDVDPAAALDVGPSSAATDGLPATSVPSTGVERAPLRGSPAKPAPCTVRGRCLDASTGATLPGVSVHLHWGLDVEACRAAGLSMGAQKMLSATTDSAGVFEFEFEPAVAAWCEGELHRAGFVELTGASARLAVGSTHDFGDVALSRGCSVRGRVLDAAGRPQAAVRVSLQRLVPEVPSGWRPTQNANERTSADGTFALPRALPPGRYGVTVHLRSVVTPQVVDLEGELEGHFEVTVRPLEEVPTIEGVVVDEAGVGLSQVQISRHEPRGRWGIWSERDGTFRILRGERDAEGPFRLALEAEGFQPTVTAESHAWGTAGLRLVLARGLPLTLDVSDADNGEPIEDFGVRWRPHPTEQPPNSAQRTDLRHRGRHPQGRLTFPVWRGRMFVEVEADDAGYAPSAPLTLDVAEGIVTQHVRLHRRLPTTIRIESSDGLPVAGTEVEILQASFDAPVDTFTFVRPPDGGMTTSANAAHDLARGFTDSTGQLKLMLPRGRPLAVRVLGPGVPWQVFRERTFTDGLNVLVVERGATLRGVLVPAARVGEFEGATVRLRRDFGAGGEFPPPLSRRRIVPDATSGAFEMVGVPAGSWTLELIWRNWEYCEPLAEIVALRNGETREASFPLDAIQFGHVRLEVVADGQPVEGWVRLGTRLPLRKGVAEGRVRTGEHAPTVEFHRGPRLVTASLRPGFTVHAGELVERRYELTFGTLRLHLVDAQGQPVCGAQVVASRPDAKGSRELTPSDVEGRIEALDVPQGRYRLRIRRLTLTDSAAESAFLAANPDARREDLSVDLAEVEVTATDAEHRLAVPRAALR